MAKLDAARERVAKVTGQVPKVTLCYEAGYDGFWLARFLEHRGVDCRVMEPASLYQGALIMTHRDRAGDPLGHRAGQRAGRREAAGPAGHRQGFATPAPICPLPVRLRDRNGGFPRLSDGPWL